MRKLALVYAALLAACTVPRELTPPTGPGTSYPCGVGGVECRTQHTCCSGVETCGGEPGSVGCPPGACCAIDTGMVGVERETKQRPQK